MKNLFSLFLLFLGITGGARSQTCSTTISTFPYFQNFEAGAGGWTSGGTVSSWALGTPAKSVINSAASGTKAWVTNLTGSYISSEQSYVESPCFNTTSIPLPQIEMKIWWNSEFSSDGAVLQSSIDGGNTWQNVGAMGDPDNWYNDNSINGAPGGQSAATAVGWTGRNSTANGSGGWVTAKHMLTGLGGKASVKLRIAFGADVSTLDQGFAFDDILIYDTPANDAGITAISSPGILTQPSINAPITVTLKNYGTTALTAATLGFSVDGTVVTNNYAFTGNIASNQTATGVTIGNYTFPAGAHTLKVWSKLPNGAPDGYTGNDSISLKLSSCNSLSGTYTINKGLPVSATNYQSFTTAFQSLKTCGISGPVIFNIVGGPYTEAVTISDINGTSATNTITFNGNGNSLINATAAGDVLKLDGAKYFRFNNLKVEVDPAATAGAVVSLINNAQYNIFTSCTFTHSTTTATTSHGVYVYSGSSNNTFQNNTVIGGYYGMYNAGVYNSSTSIIYNNNNKFIGNTIKDPNYYGVHCAYTTDALFEGNDISRPTRSNAGTFYGFNISSNCTGLIVSKNRLHNTHDAATITTGTVYGIYILAAGNVGSENIIKNNAFYNIQNSGGTLYAIYTSSGNNTYFYHNTISADNLNVNYATLRGLYLASSPTNIKFINNIISLSSPATSKHAIYLSYASTPLVSDNNDLYIGSTGNVGYYLADKTTLADWKAANTNAYDQNSVSANPQFVNLATGILQPTNLILNNVGQPMPAVTEDITGAARNATTPDPGAYEFSPAANDAALTALVSPTSPVTPGVSQPVTVTLKNFGTNPLATATITWSVNGTAQASYNWAGLLNSGQTANVTVGNYTFPAGSHTLNICATLPNGVADQNTGNDCLNMALNSCNPLSGAYTINKNAAASATNFISFASSVNTLGNCGVSGPVTIDVVAATGPYTEAVEITNIQGTSATNTITINGNANILSSPSAAMDIVLKLNGAKYLRFNNLKIETNISTSSGSVVLLVNSAMYNVFNGCILTHSISTSATSQVISLLNGCSNNTFQNNTLIGAYHGIYNFGAASVPNISNTFTGNIIKDQYFYGIQNSYAPNTLIEGNDISRPTRTNGVSFYAIYNSAGSTETIISKNRIHNTYDANTTAGSVYGIVSSAVGTVGDENIVKNNIFYNNPGPTLSLYPIYNSGASNTYYYYNTISVDNPGSICYSVRGMYFSAASTNIKFINNIISLGSTSNTKHAIYAQTPGILLTSNNNDFYAPNGNIGYYSGDKATLADWRTVAGTDQASVSVNPVFANAVTGDLHPTTVSLNNLGQPVTGITEDISGAVRNTTTPDMGALEFSVNSTDVGITAISGPVASGCGLTAAETITVTIKNFGSTIQTTIPVSYSISATGVVNETYNGSIAPNATATYSFTAKANLATSGIFAIAAQTNLTGDGDATNDAATLNVTNSLMPALPVTFDFETANTGLNRFYKVINPKSNLTEGVGASNGSGSAKGMILDGIDNVNWIAPAGTTDPWTSNPDNFAAAYICISPSGGGLATDSLVMTFDLKQLYKSANVSTNFRVTVNGTQVGPTFRPPFSGMPITWQKVKVDLTPYKNGSFVTIGLESSVKEAFANGTGTANLIDNISIKRVAGPTGVKEDKLDARILVFPNPGKGQFNIDFPAGKNFQLEITDLSGKVLKKQTATGGISQLNLEGAVKGIYLLKVSGENGAAIRKLILE